MEMIGGHRVSILFMFFSIISFIISISVYCVYRYKNIYVRKCSGVHINSTECLITWELFQISATSVKINKNLFTFLLLLFSNSGGYAYAFGEQYKSKVIFKNGHQSSTIAPEKIPSRYNQANNIKKILKTLKKQTKWIKVRSLFM